MKVFSGSHSSWILFQGLGFVIGTRILDYWVTADCGDQVLFMRGRAEPGFEAISISIDHIYIYEKSDCPNRESNPRSPNLRIGALTS